MTKIVKNLNAPGEPQNFGGIMIDGGSQYSIPDDELEGFQKSQKLMNALTSEPATASIFSDTNATELTGTAAIVFLIDQGQLVHVETNPFAAKEISLGKLYRRKHGWKIVDIAPGETGSIDINVPYDIAKVNELEIVNSRVGDTVSLKVKDTPTGMITATLAATGFTPIPNFMLNQFGFDCELPDGLFRDHSDYDAQLYKDMKMTIEYTNNGTEDFTVRGNMIFHEVKQ